MEPKEPVRESLFSTPAPLPVVKLDDEGRLACLRLARSTGIGPATFRELINHYGGAKQALNALPHITKTRSSAKKFKICTIEDAQSELEAANKIGATPVFTIEPGYPHYLANLPVPPPLLYILGDASLLQQPAISIVGARLASAAGIKLARIFAHELGRAGLVVVSGLARGIDRSAHEAALSTGTIAVVAGGVDVIYPPEHQDLHEQITKNGCIVSEMPCGFQPRAKDFPRRNRIISGLSLGVLVVEAAKRSGSLVTARQAGEQNRELFAVPGHPFDPRAQGTNDLLKKSGATFVTEPNDILEALRPMAGIGIQGFREPRAPQAITPSSEGSVEQPEFHKKTQDEQIQPSPNDVVEHIAPAQRPNIKAQSDESMRDLIRQTLSAAPIDLDAIVRATGLAAHTVRATLLDLELAGEIERHGANLISLNPNTPKYD